MNVRFRVKSLVASIWAIKYNRWLLAILLVGLGLRLGMALYLGEAVEPIAPAYDQIYYHDVALNLLAGKGFSFIRPPSPYFQPYVPTSYVSFLYCAFVAGVYALFGPHALAVRIVQAVICSLLPLLVYRLTRRVLTEGAGPEDRAGEDQDLRDRSRERAEAVALVAAGIAAVYAYFVFFGAVLMTEGLYLIGIAWALDLTLLLARQPTARRWATWGFVVALTCLLRQVFMPIAVLLFLYVLWRARRAVRVGHVALAVLVGCAIILPWTVRNYLVFDRFLLLNSLGGIIFWSGNHPALGTQWGIGHWLAIPPELASLNEVDLNSVLVREGWREVMADPGRFLLLSLDRTAEFFRFWPAPESSLFNNLARTASFTICLPFMIAGLFVSLREWRRWSLLYLLIICYTLIHVISWAGIRYRMPVDLALVPFAALAIDMLISRLGK